MSDNKENNSKIQEKAFDSLQEKASEVPTWAKAWIGILTALVTIVLALGLNIGNIIESKINNAMDLNKTSMSYNYELDRSALTALTDNTSSLNGHILKANELNTELLKENLRLKEEIKELQRVIDDLRSRVVKMESRLK